MKEDNKTIGEVGQQKLMHNWAKTESTLLTDYDISKVSASRNKARVSNTRNT